MEAEAFAAFKTIFSDVIEALVQMMRFGTLAARDFAVFISEQPLLLALFLLFAVGLGVGLLRRIKSL